MASDAAAIDYPSFATESLSILKKKYDETCDETTWAKMIEYGDVKMSHGSVKDNDFLCLKATIVVKASVTAIGTMLANADRVPEYDVNIVKCEIVESLWESTDITGDGASIRRVRAKGVFPTQARDFVVLSSKVTDQDDGGGVMIASRSVLHDNAPVSSSYTRANLFISGFVIVPMAQGQTMVTVISHIDVGGYVPASIINALVTSAPVGLMESIKRICEAESSEQ